MFATNDDLLIDALAGLGAASDRPVRAGTRAVQNWINSFAAQSGGTRISEDGVWGCQTTLALGRLLVWMGAQTGTLTTAGSTLVAGIAAAQIMERVDKAGPLPYTQLLASGIEGHPALTSAQIGEAHAGWSDWVVAGRPCPSASATTGERTMMQMPPDVADQAEDVVPPPAPPSNVGRYVAWGATGVVIALVGWWAWRRNRG